jgi:hypothetical protein
MMKTPWPAVDPVVAVVPEQRPGFGDLALQQIGDRHARIGPLVLVADHGDLVVRPHLADGFGGDHTGRSVAEDDVLHGRCLARERDAGATVAPRREPVGGGADVAVRKRDDRRPPRAGSQAEAGARLGRRNAVRGPAALGVVFRQHLVEAVDQTLGRTGLGSGSCAVHWTG